jgi:hypothetical protein
MEQCSKQRFFLLTVILKKGREGPFLYLPPVSLRKPYGDIAILNGLRVG